MKNGSASAGKTGGAVNPVVPPVPGPGLMQAKKAEFTAFRLWITGKTRQGAHAGSARTVRRQCVVAARGPTSPVTGEIHPVVMVDGTYFKRWCDREKRSSWSALLQQLPAPTMDVIDGHKGLESALHQHLSDTRVHRCLFHIQQNIRTHPTMRLQLDAGKELLALAKALTPIQSLDQAAVWDGEFASWEAR